MTKKIAFMLIAGAVLLAANGSFAGYLAPSLIEELEQLEPGQRIEVIVHMKEKANLDELSYLSKPEKVQYLKDFVADKQSDILGYLSAKGDCEVIQTWWVFNGFLMEATQDVINDIAKRDDVDYIIDNFYQICIPKSDPLGFPGGNQPAVQWNIEIIRADEVWTEGYDGAGIVIGTMDTGVDYDHSALFSNWRPNDGWFDAINSQPLPYDDHGHGTATMGIMVGAYGIGVAPGAKWVHAKVMNSAGGGTAAQFHSGFNWIAGLAATGMEPRVVSNSWGWGDRTSTEYWDDCATWKGLDILPVFAIANDGPGVSTDDAPGNYPLCLGVGATDSWDDIASFSSRGPAPNISPWNVASNWYRPDWDRIKPDISAPGVGIFTCAPLPDEYQSGFGGTSGASPHIGGVCALMLQKNPTLTATQLYNAITDNAAYPTQGAPYPNNDYGWGRIDAYKAVNNCPEATTPCIAYVSRVINDGGNGELDPGESNVTLIVTLKNMGFDATNVTATLSENSVYVSVGDAAGAFGNIAHGGSASNSSNTFEITAVGIAPQGSRIDFTLDISADGGYTTRQWFSIYIAAQPSGFSQTLSYYGDPAYFWRLPDSYGDSLFNERFTAPGACSLLAARFLFYTKSGTAGIRAYAWRSTGTEPSTKIDSVYIPYASIDLYPTWTEVDFPSLITFTAGERFHIGYQIIENVAGDTVSILSDDGSSGGERSWEWYASAWSTMLADWGLDVDFHIEADVEGGISAPAIMYDQKYVDDRLFNNNGYMDPGETVDLIVSLSNVGLAGNNVQATLRTSDANCTLIDSTANYGNIQKDKTVDNSSDPFTLRLSDFVANGYTVAFTLHIEANGGSYTTDENFSIESEYVPQPSDLFVMNFYEGQLWYNSDYNNYWWAQYFNPMTPCSLRYFWICTQLNGSGVNGTVYVWGHDAGNFQPDIGAEIFSSGGLSGGWQRYDVKDVVPEEFWIGFDQVGKLEPVFSATENGISLVSMDDGATWPYLWYDLAIDAYMVHFSPVLTYLTPDGWDFSIVPSGDAADSTFPSSLPAEPGMTYVHDWCSWNRSDSAITADFDNLLIRDYFGEVIAEVTGGLAAWYYTSLDSVDIAVPGGRHTLWEIIDYNEEVPVYSGNWPYMFIGKQFVWEPMPVTFETSYLHGPPASYTPFSGPYYNCDGFVMNVPAQWAGFGVRKRDLTTDDTTDVDVRLFSDYSGIFSGFSDMLATSALGGAEVDFVLVDGNYAGGKVNYYPGVYAFYGFDSTYVQASSRGLLEKGEQTAVINIDAEDVLMVWDWEATAGLLNTVTVNVTSGSPDIALAFYSGSADDPYERRMDHVAEADVNGPGGSEVLTYTSPTTQTLGLVLWCKNGVTGTIEIPGVLLGIELTEFTATAYPGVISVQWTTASEYNVSKFLVKRSIGEKDYEEATVIGEMEGHLNSPTPNTYTVEDRGIETEEMYHYWLVEVKTSGPAKVYGPVSVKGYPLRYSFSGPSPNPIYKSASFVYSIPGNTTCGIKVYDVQGRLIRIENRRHDAGGYYTFAWDGKDNAGKRVSEGIYFVRFNADDFQMCKKIILMR